MAQFSFASSHTSHECMTVYSNFCLE